MLLVLLFVFSVTQCDSEWRSNDSERPIDSEWMSNDSERPTDSEWMSNESEREKSSEKEKSSERKSCLEELAERGLVNTQTLGKD